MLVTGDLLVEQGCSLNNVLRLGGQIPRDPALHAFSWAICGSQIYDRFRNTLKMLRILNLVQIGDVICTLALDGSARLRTIRGIC